MFGFYFINISITEFMKQIPWRKIKNQEWEDLKVRKPECLVKLLQIMVFKKEFITSEFN